MTDPFTQLRELPRPVLESSFSSHVLGRARAILGQRPARPQRQRWELLFAAIVGTLGVLHSLWVVGFIHQLYR